MNPTATIDRQQRAREWVRVLSEIPARFAGSASERQAAEHVATWLQELGVSDVALVRAAGGPRPGYALALHAAVAGLGLYCGGFLGAILAVVAVVSFRQEVMEKRPALSRLLPAEDSVTVLGRVGPGSPGSGSPGSGTPARRVLLSAHIDTTQAGWLFSRPVAERFARLQDFSAGPPVGPLALPYAVLLATALIAVAGWLGAHGFLFGLARFADKLALLVMLVLPLQWAQSPATPGANDNASAVASMLTCAQALLKDLPADVELWIAGTGAEETSLGGMKAALRPEWPPQSTYCINFECTGGGNLHVIRSEGLLRKIHYPATMVELARRIAAGGQFGEITPVDLLAGTDGCIPAGLGYPTLSIISLEANGVPRNYHRVEDTIDDIDPALLVRAGDFGAAVARAALRGEAGPIG